MSEYHNSHQPHPWIIDETHDDPVLEELIARREFVIDYLADHGGRSGVANLEDSVTQEQRHELFRQIALRQDALGIDPIEEPFSERQRKLHRDPKRRP